MAYSNQQVTRSYNNKLRTGHSSNTDGQRRSLISEEPMETGDPYNSVSLRSGHSDVSDRMKKKSTMAFEHGSGRLDVSDRMKQKPVTVFEHGSGHSTFEHGSGRSDVSDRMKQKPETVSEHGSGHSDVYDRTKKKSTTTFEHGQSCATGGIIEHQPPGLHNKHPRESRPLSKRNEEEHYQAEQYPSDTHSSGSGGSGFVQGLINLLPWSKTSSSPDTTKEDDKQGSSKAKTQHKHCSECDKKDEEIKRLRNQSYQFMMEIELHLEGRDVNGLRYEWNDFFTNKIPDIDLSETLLCKLFQACYDVVHNKVIELCGTHMECLFKVYDDTAVPEDMKDIKNEKCRCYIKLVSAFEMNQDKKDTLEDLESRLERHLKEHVPELTIKHPQLNSFLTESLKLSWKLATCVPPMIATCDEKHYDRKIHSRVSLKKEVPDKYTLEYHSPTLYTNYTGHVQAQGQVEIISDSVSETNQTLQSTTGPEKPSLELVMAEVSDELKDVVMLQKFAHAIGMPQNKIDLVFSVVGAKSKDNLHQIITWWIKQRKPEPKWGKLADAVKNTGNHGLAARIRQKYC